MQICILTEYLDIFKGGNHIPLFGALGDVAVTVLTGCMKPVNPDLPENVTVINLNERLGPYYYGFSGRRFAKAVLRKYPPSNNFWQKFDVIHLNQTMGSKLIELKETKKPILYTVHHPVTADCSIAVRESSFIAGLRWRVRYLPLKQAQQRICKNRSNVMTVSETVKQLLCKDYDCSADKIFVVPNGVDGDVFHPEDTIESEFDVIALGSFIHPRKGFKYLLEAYKKLAGLGYRIADVGRRSGEQEKDLARIEGVTVHGIVEPDQVVSLLKKSAVLISASLYEGFGLSLIEALACGRAAFAFGSGAVPEVLAPIDENLFVPPRDTGALVDRVQKYLSLPAGKKAELGRKYREKVLDLYSLENAAGQLKELYRSLAS